MLAFSGQSSRPVYHMGILKTKTILCWLDGPPDQYSVREAEISAVKVLEEMFDGANVGLFASVILRYKKSK